MSSPPIGGHAHRVAVAGDAGHHALDQPLLPGLGRVAEEEGVHDGDRAGAHGEDVPQDAAHPGGRPLVGLDGRGMVVGLDPDGHGDPVAGVDDPGVLPGPDQHVGSLGGQPPQVDPRRLVGAVLAPHHGEQGQFEVVGRPAEDAFHLVALGVGQPERTVQRLPRPVHQVGLLVSARLHGPQRYPAGAHRSRWPDVGSVGRAPRTGVPARTVHGDRHVADIYPNSGRITTLPDGTDRRPSSVDRRQDIQPMAVMAEPAATTSVTQPPDGNAPDLQRNSSPVSSKWAYDAD